MRYSEEQSEEEGDKIKEVAAQADEDWADKMEAEEAEQEKVQQYDPLKDPKNLEWMQEQLQKEKEEHGESFGEDISLDFGDE